MLTRSVTVTVSGFSAGTGQVSGLAVYVVVLYRCWASAVGRGVMFHKAAFDAHPVFIILRAVVSVGAVLARVELGEAHDLGLLPGDDGEVVGYGSSPSTAGTQTQSPACAGDIAH